jgi:2-polyprenyl-3-methyl-5-hydroxy-6-metoxy-1,4-benzoquinol methylase
MDASFWDQRFSQDEPVYGETPNQFFAQQLAELTPGRLLLAAEGQGRNAIHAAQLGWQVDAFDYSSVAQARALALAAKAGVTISYQQMSYQTLTLPEGTYDAVGLVFAHMDPQLRPEVHAKLARSLRAGGTLLLEGFHKRQLGLDSGGPRSEAMLFSETELSEDFQDWLGDLRIEPQRITLAEGPYHQGVAEVIRVVGRRLGA